VSLIIGLIMKEWLMGKKIMETTTMNLT